MLTKYNTLEGNSKIINIIKSFVEEFDIKVIYMNKVALKLLLKSKLVNVLFSCTV